MIFVVFLTILDNGIYLKTSPGLDYDAIQQYLLSVICNDTFTGTTTEIFTVNILQNQPPIITNIAGKKFHFLVPLISFNDSVLITLISQCTLLNYNAFYNC